MNLKELKSQIEGDIFEDSLHQAIYATDASVYRQIPLGVAYPKHAEDLQKIIQFAHKKGFGLIPRTAGTSLAGQCVGTGLVVDVSKHFTQIISLDKENKTVTVAPGVIRDELNNYLKPYGLFFGPNTSTSNRCMIGGMVGNNSSGTTSIKYGVTRDHIKSLKGFLSDGSQVVFQDWSLEEWNEKCKETNLLGEICSWIDQQLSQKNIQERIIKEYPKKSIHRRNTGYALDALLEFEKFGGTQRKINLCKLLSGSEGTLFFTSEITLTLDVLPPENSLMIVSHFNNLEDSLNAVLVAMKHELYTCELMDKMILDCTKSNREQVKNRFFLKGNPEAVLMLEIRAESDEKVKEKAAILIRDLQEKTASYHNAWIEASDISKVMNLRKAGLGLLGNIIGDDKAVACIEDTAVDLEDLPSFIKEFALLMEEFDQQAVYYAHAGAGELHLRPILNLKKQKGIQHFREITTATAHLVKKYRGSFSGEHGDGIVRAEFIPFLIGEENYQLLCELKSVFDSKNIFNPGKIVHAPAMDENLRYTKDRIEPEITTKQDFSENQGILRLVEKCNGSGDCRRNSISGGVMCPSYRASKEEKNTTRARANALREFLTNSDQKNPFNHPELKEVLDLCLSCKACSSECPSNVDIASVKAEFLYQYQKENGFSFRNKIFANNTHWISKLPLPSGIINSISNATLTKKIMGIAPERAVPKLAKQHLRKWFKSFDLKTKKSNKKVYFFFDEFTNLYDVSIGKQAIQLLDHLGYQILAVQHPESGRSYISKGFLDQASEIAEKQITLFGSLISEEIPLVGVEPSAILSFRDEYKRLVKNPEQAKKLAQNVFTIEEFLWKEFEKGRFSSEIFIQNKAEIKIHGHCHQKALTNTSNLVKLLSIPKNYKASLLVTGCCGMAGSFGYEVEHYELSQKIGADSVFPAVRGLQETNILVASGTSCRHQIKDGVEQTAHHPVSVLFNALI